MHNIFHLLDIIKKRPWIFLWDNKISTLRTFIAWYWACLDEYNIVERESLIFDELHEWVTNYYKYEKSAKGWPTIIKEQTKTEEEALQLFFELLEKFKAEKGIK